MRTILIAALLLSAAPCAAFAQETGRDVVERLEEFDVQTGPNGEIEVCGALPTRAPVNARRPQIEAALRAGLDHAGCINDHSTQVNQSFLELMTWVGERARLLTPAQENAALAQINRIDARVKASEAWKIAYFRDRLRPVVQDGNRRLGLSNDPLGQYLQQTAPTGRASGG